MTTTTFSQWSAEKAWEWYDRQPWPCGFNYIPASAINCAEMWMDYGFDPSLIAAELALGREIGFNCARVMLPFVVWEHEPDLFKRRFDTFLEICRRHGLGVMPVLFDDCAFGPAEDSVFGRQPEVIPGWFMNGWTPSPGHSFVHDPESWPRLAKYAREIIGGYRGDSRVWVWDLYNEPTNCGMGDISLPLVEEVFRWAREMSPSQPLTVGRWNDDAGLNAIIKRLSDISTFHDYTGPEALENNVREIKRQGRPAICTEWMARNASTVAGCLPILRRENIGAIHWGLVNGRTQTHLNWGHRPGDPDPLFWQHDLFHADHTPFDAAEIRLFKETIA
jgi:hypothetical protein